jgi:hypothetical protein
LPLDPGDLSVNEPWLGQETGHNRDRPQLREALSLIHWLRDQAKPQSEWLDTIAADQSLTEPVRQRALQFAREWK